MTDHLIGKKWEACNNDCFSVIRDFYATIGITLPNINYDSSNWRDVAKEVLVNETKKYFTEVIGSPRLGDIVIIGKEHLGVMVDNERVLNCDIKRGTFLRRLNRFALPVWIGRINNVNSG